MFFVNDDWIVVWMGMALGGLNRRAKFLRGKVVGRGLKQRACHPGLTRAKGGVITTCHVTVGTVYVAVFHVETVSNHVGQ